MSYDNEGWTRRRALEDVRKASDLLKASACIVERDLSGHDAVTLAGIAKADKELPALKKRLKALELAIREARAADRAVQRRDAAAAADAAKRARRGSTAGNSALAGASA